MVTLSPKTDSNKTKLQTSLPAKSLQYGINIGTEGVDFVLEAPPGKKVYWVGDYNNWSTETPLNYDQNLKGYHFFMPASAFGIYFYKWVIDGQWILDPHNSHHYTNGTMGTNSMIKMPAYHEPFEVFEKTVPSKSNLKSYEVPSKILKSSRQVHVYLPEKYFLESESKFPLLILQDGSECVDLLPAQTIFDHLINQRLVSPFVCLLVSPQPGNRDRDYIFNKKFERFLAEELLEWASDQNFRFSDNPYKRAILGYSLGGLVSVRTALHYPNVFRLAGGESSAFWPEKFKIFDEVMHLNPLKTQFYLGCGNLDGGQEMTALMAGLLTRLGVQYQSRISIGGHDWYYWKTHLRHSLQYFFPV